MTQPSPAVPSAAEPELFEPELFDPELFDAAVRAQAHAYVPYSNFPAGAAVRSASGRVYVGCNVENAAYPQGWCREFAGPTTVVHAAGPEGIRRSYTMDELLPDGFGPENLES